MNVNIKLTVEEVNAVLSTLGQMPTSSGVYPLLLSIKQQAEAHVHKQQAEAQILPQTEAPSE